ncbi:MAG: PH domain-containing protein [Muribaculaceae bacterium]|nr:PH domain-containing protein [Muribaculaceae bacterium]
MRSKVSLSTYYIIISILGIAIFVGLMLVNLNRGIDWLGYALAAALVLICGLSLFFTPLSISVEDGCLNVNMALRVKSISLIDIKNVSICPPTMAEKRIFGSGGWFGYWGWFSEPSIGKYMAYYGKASDCFLVRMNNGKQYMLSCNDPLGMMEYINSAISKH